LYINAYYRKETIHKKGENIFKPPYSEGRAVTSVGKVGQGYKMNNINIKDLRIL
jgi:hypothetical protein